MLQKVSQAQAVFKPKQALENKTSHTFKSNNMSFKGISSQAVEKLLSVGEPANILSILRGNPSIAQGFYKMGIAPQALVSNLKEAQQHADRVAKLAVGLYEMTPKGMRGDITKKEVEIACALHDIGKIGIPDRVINKPGPLDGGEFEIMAFHSVLGKLIFEKSGNAGTDLGRKVLAIIEGHHQDPSGTGYPFGAKHPFGAQLAKMADVFDALTHDRVYKKAFSREVALDIMQKDVEKGKLDPVLFGFLKKLTDPNSQREVLYRKLVDRFSSVFPKRHQRGALDLAG